MRNRGSESGRLRARAGTQHVPANCRQQTAIEGNWGHSRRLCCRLRSAVSLGIVIRGFCGNRAGAIGAGAGDWKWFDRGGVQELGGEAVEADGSVWAVIWCCTQCVAKFRFSLRVFLRRTADR